MNIRERGCVRNRIAGGTDEVEDDLLTGGVFVVGGGEGFEVHSAMGAEEQIAGVSHHGGASRRDAVLGLEDEQAGEEVGDVGGGLKLGDGAKEFGGEGRIGIAASGTEEMSAAEAGLRIDGFGQAAATAGGAMDAAGRGLDGGWGRCVGRLVIRWRASRIHFETFLFEWAFIRFWGTLVTVSPGFCKEAASD